MISKAQNAFVKSRQILDAVLVANEALDSINGLIGYFGATPQPIF